MMYSLVFGLLLLLLQYYNVFSFGTRGFSISNRINRISSFAPSSQRSQGNQLKMEFIWKPVKKDVEGKMAKCIDSIQTQFNTLRAAGANPAILDRVMVDYFGSMTPLNQVARVATSGSQQLVVEPFDKSSMKDIEKAIAISNLNLTPNNDGNVIRINLPALTEDRRKELVKQAKSILEEGKVAVRNVRRDVVDKIKAAEKAKDISKDDAKDFQDDLQKVTDDYIKKLDNMMKVKEKDLLTI